MEIQLTGGPIPHDIQYFLDCSVECMDMPPDVYMWAKHFNPNTAELIDNFDQHPELRANEHWKTLRNYGAFLERRYLEWQETAPYESVALCLAYGMHYMPETNHVLKEAIGTLVDTSRSLLRGISYYDNAVAYEAGGIVHYDGLKFFERNQGFFESLYRIRQQFAALDPLDWSQVKIKQPKWVERHRLNHERFLEEIHDERELEDPRFRKHRIKVLDKTKKKALRRSADLLDTITGEKTTKLFLSGEEVSVTGQKYRFSLTKDRHASLNMSYGAARTRVYDAQTDEFICGLCVYTANVTVFDHLASLVLHCKSGLEDQIIMDANIMDHGNLKLLPQAKIDAMERPHNPDGPWNDILMDTLDTAERGIMGAIARMENPTEQMLKKRAEALNAQAFKKFERRIRKKHPHLFAYQRQQIPQVAQLFYGHEVG